MSEDTTTLPITVRMNVSVQSIKDLLCNAIEGGSNYWCAEINRQGGITQEEAPYRQDVPFVRNGFLEVKENNEDGEGRTFDLYVFNLLRGLELMAEKYPHHFKDFMDENADATTGDVFLQCCCFQEIIYG